MMQCHLPGFGVGSRHPPMLPAAYTYNQCCFCHARARCHSWCSSASVLSWSPSITPRCEAMHNQVVYILAAYGCLVLNMQRPNLVDSINPLRPCVAQTTYGRPCVQNRLL